MARVPIGSSQHHPNSVCECVGPPDCRDCLLESKGWSNAGDGLGAGTATAGAGGTDAGRGVRVTGGVGMGGDDSRAAGFNMEASVVASAVAATVAAVATVLACGSGGGGCKRASGGVCA
eukprot:6154210-Pleurochrysis_carterae.AAC.1